MKIRIWGARGSTPSPIQAGEIRDKLVNVIQGMPPMDTTETEAVRAYVESLPPLLAGTAGGNTTCVEIDAAGETIILDAGTGIQELGRALMDGPCGRGQGRVHLIFSHAHWDHIQGFPFFVPAFVPGNRITIYSVHDMERVLRYQQAFRVFPVAYDRQQAIEEASRYQSPSGNPLVRPIPYMKAERDFVQLDPGTITRIGPVEIRTALNIHDGDAYAFRLEEGKRSFVFASDAEYIEDDEESLCERVRFFRGADLLLFDAQYGLRDTWESKEGFGHSSAMIGVDLARRAGVKQLLLSHHDPTHTDAVLSEILATAIAYHEQEQEGHILTIKTAYEGMTIDLSGDDLLDTDMEDDSEQPESSTSDDADGAELRNVQTLLARLMQDDSANPLVIDLASVERLTTAGLKSLLDYERHLDRGQLVLVAASESIEDMIRLSGYGDHFGFYPTVDDANLAVSNRISNRGSKPVDT